MVKLRNVGLSENYRRSLKEGSDLLERLAGRGHVVSAKVSPNLVDAWLEAAVQEAHDEGAKLYWVTLGVLGIQRRLKLSGPLLRGTWRAIQGWRSMKPVHSRVPITAYCLEAVVLFCVKEGWKMNGWLRKQWWACGLALWLGFTCLLRPAEVLQLRVGDLSFSTGQGERALDPGMVVVVRTPKTRRIWHRQFVLCVDERLERWMHWWISGLGRGRQLFPFSRYLWSKMFGECLSRLDLSSCGFSLGSLRAGGATNHFRKHSNLGALQFLGRWTSSHTMQFYLQEAFSTHVEANFSEKSRELLCGLNDFSHLLKSPPRSSLVELLRSCCAWENESSSC